jgi:cell division protein FtsL
MKTNNKTSKFKAKISTDQEGNQEQSAEDLLRCERIKKLERKKDAPKVDRKM